ncbi:MAG TPA: hypothetical protein VEQ59_20315, partial [Polyangiaceae bacterium]|nr:hypothetical protein [Polyangiaceae bacterium]
MIQLNDAPRRAALLAAALLLACTSGRRALDAKSGAPEYRGTADLPWVIPSATTDPPPAALAAPPTTIAEPPVAPALTSDGLYVLRDGGLELTIDAQHGGHIASFTLDGRSPLADAGLVPTGGATAFWPSPAAAWQGSVPPELDREPYGARVEGETLWLQSEASAALGLRFEKRYRLDAHR